MGHQIPMAEAKNITSTITEAQIGQGFSVFISLS